jgi:hypothetical protein
LFGHSILLRAASHRNKDYPQTLVILFIELLVHSLTFIILLITLVSASLSLFIQALALLIGPLFFLVGKIIFLIKPLFLAFGCIFLRSHPQINHILQKKPAKTQSILP